MLLCIVGLFVIACILLDLFVVEKLCYNSVAKFYLTVAVDSFVLCNCGCFLLLCLGCLLLICCVGCWLSCLLIICIIVVLRFVACLR